MLAYVAGMVDMVALPVWIGTLMQHYRYSPAQAGITVTLFLLGVVLSSLFFAPRFNRMPRRAAATAGFALAALAFLVAAMQPVGIEGFGMLAAVHAVAGLGVGCGLSFTDGAMGRSANPHRLWAMANVALGVFAVVFLGGMPQLLMRVEASALFVAYAGLMALAALAVGLAFPAVDSVDADAQRAMQSATEAATASKIPRAAWFVIAAVVCLTLNQAMVFSFVERIGASRGFAPDQVQAVLIALGLVNLVPGVLAAVLQTKWSPIAVGMAGPIGQAVLALVMTAATGYAPYAVAASLYVFMVIFTHTFLFGLLAKLDGSGRAVAATPAMMMLGSCIGPALGGGIVQAAGYPALGWAACCVTVLALVAMSQVGRSMRRASARPLASAPEAKAA